MILHILGLLILINGAFMLITLLLSLLFKDGAHMGLAIAGGISLSIGALTWFATKKHEPTISKREGFLVVTLGWLSLSLTGSLPYLFTGTLPDFANAFFETVSGYTTTGATTITDLSLVPDSILFWRSLTQWIGGMGIIVLTIAILPILGIGGMELFSAESPGPSADKLHPRIKETAKRLWFIYVSLTTIETILLKIAGMDTFEAVCHSMTTLSTGGFSTRNESVAAFSPVVHYIITLFMFLAGMNFALTYFAIKGKLKRVWINEEFRTFLISVIIVTLFATIGIAGSTGGFSEESFRDALFQTVSIITTTGFVTADYTSWTPFLTFLFFILMFVGASSGSTSGAMKQVRFIIVIKNGLLELKRQLHPSAIIPVRFNRRSVGPKTTYNILAFFLLYITVFVAGGAALSIFKDVDMLSAIGASAASIGNIGPGIGKVGPMDNFSWIPDSGKVILAALMLVGRLEMFTVLILFTPAFWRSV